MNAFPRFLPGVALALLGIVTASATTADLTMAVAPARPTIEYRDNEQIVNFDLLVSNHSAIAYRLVAIRLQVKGSNGLVEVSRQVNGNGQPAALPTIGPLRIGPGETADYFQPFEHFSHQVDLDRMHFELLFMADGHPAPVIPFDADVVLTLDVAPEAYHPSSFCLPLTGRLLVQDGHDLYSHHRRRNLATSASLGKVGPSPNLFAYDLVNVDERGIDLHGDPADLRNWLSYGSAVRAPAAGVVIAVQNAVPENRLTANGMVIPPDRVDEIDPDGLGNYVLLRHADGRHSWLLHLQPGSLTVSLGQRVRAGQALGRVGFSGDSLFPHLHFTVTNGPQYPSQGVPSYFSNVAHLLGGRRVVEQSTQIDSGDIVSDRGGDCAVAGRRGGKRSD